MTNTASVSWTIFESPLGPLTLLAGPTRVTALHFAARAGSPEPMPRPPAPLAEATRQLEQYFAGERRRFELPLDLAGTPFQRRVWQELLRLPYGTTVSYSELAERVGRSDRLRAVAAAVGRTPLPILVPCHRVVAADGRLTGYVGGLPRKQALLDLERRAAAGLRPEPAWAFRQLALL